jgi:hypothetical protein
MKFFYLRDENNNPVACVASYRIPSGDEIFYGVSTHNPIDRFSRQEARVHAVMHSDQNHPYSGRAALRPGVKQDIVTQIANNDKMPKRTRAAAKLWLDNRPRLDFVTASRIWKALPLVKAFLENEEVRGKCKVNWLAIHQLEQEVLNTPYSLHDLEAA